jgi:type II secretory pathway component HofQ
MKWALIVSTAAGLMALSSPVLADCAQDIDQLDAQFKQTESQSGQPAATPHQTQTMQGAQPQEGTAGTMPSAGSAPDAASSTHQREALKGAGETSPQEQFATHLQEARQLAQNGDQAGCMAKVEAARKLLGTP